MTIKNIIGECLVKMGKENFVNKTQYDSEEQELIAKLLSCVNIVYREIVAHHLPLIQKESVTLENGVLDISTLSKNIIYPISLHQGEEKKKMRAYPCCIESDFSGTGMLEYAYMPAKEFVIGDSIDDMRITQSVMANGALREFYFASKLFDLAESFDNEFLKELGTLKYKGREIRIKRRGWR